MLFGRRSASRKRMLDTVSRRSVRVGVGVLIAVLVALLAFTASHVPTLRTTVQQIVGTSEPDGRPVTLDTTLYLPQHTPAPAVLLAHGFGGSKAELVDQAQSLARAGFVVLAYSARGFGASGGLIHLDSLDYEVKDASLLVDWLAKRSEVESVNGDPKVAVAGASYGGALSLMLAGTDPRIDAVAADITWNDLQSSLFPNQVFKKMWAGYLFEGAVPRGSDPSCGRFAPDLCREYQQSAATGTPTDGLLSLIARSDPALTNAHVKAPVLLSQGQQDSLFPLSQADANAREIAAAGTPVKVVWRSGGHDGGGAPDAGSVENWFADVFAGKVHGQQPFDMVLGDARAPTSTGNTDVETVSQPQYAVGSKTATVPLKGNPQTIAAPAGGSPAAITSLPGVGAALGRLGALGGAALPTGSLNGQSARWCSDPLAARTVVAGSPTVTLDVEGAPDATLFVALREVSGAGSGTLPSGLVAPIRVAQPGPVTISLPWIVHAFSAGSRMCLDVSTTDFGYAMPADARTYSIALSGQLTVPEAAAPPRSSGRPVAWLIVGAIVVAAAGVFLLVTRPRTGKATIVPESVPVVVDGLVKEYSDGYRAVDGVSFDVQAGQVVGLLGPNGAGKTTALRVLVGLTRPTSGEVKIFGEPIKAGAPVLARVGAFIEGPGFLPHLSGRTNLRLYWAATGRDPAEARFDIALEIAGLGASIDRKVKTYSHGMKQRLGIAQAMLGMPDLLVLDEPTNGLDPPQIAEMREVMRAYAATGRTVIVSSHLLAEVEQTCTHVVVMHKGKLVAAGSVADVAGGSGQALAVADPTAAARVLAEAGIESEIVPARRALEDVFLELVGENQ